VAATYIAAQPCFCLVLLAGDNIAQAKAADVWAHPLAVAQAKWMRTLLN